MPWWQGTTLTWEMVVSRRGSSTANQTPHSELQLCPAPGAILALWNIGTVVSHSQECGVRMITFATTDIVACRHVTRQRPRNKSETSVAR
jgi:hypothetical protein